MYNKEIDKKWQDVWEEKKCHKAENISDKPKFYGLIEFPYPSGAGLHVGHVKAFVGMDVISRMKRMQGYNVLFPIGFDAFGLPTENYAIKTNTHPRIVTDNNIKAFTKQLKKVGFSFDWDRAVDTTDPNYFKWTQWIFIKLFEKGLAYKDKTLVNYCPSCRVILSNEESQGGVCDRCDHEVVQKEKEVWMLKITDYAEKLLEEVNNLDFKDRVKTEQINWIGKSEGAEIDFEIENEKEKLTVYTTRPDTIYGVTYMAIAPEHEIIDSLKDKILNMNEVNEYKVKSSLKTEFERINLNKEKTGVTLEGIYAINPLTKEKIKIVVADYVMKGYGTGAIMAVPAHDDRDNEFAKKFNFEIKTVIENDKLINSDIINGLNIKEAKLKIIKYLEENKLGKAKNNYHMKDWAFARQRYWGEPVPIVKCEHCGLVPLKYEDLPLTLPDLEEFMPGQDGESPLVQNQEFVNCKCPKCNRDAKRETDTMPQWAGSSWYYLRYMDPHNNQELASKEALNYWQDVDWYNGGMEHVTRHLIYSRFWHRFLYDIGVVPTKEPYKKRTYQGLILGEDNNKMSKSKGNVVNPDDVINEYGADTLRTYILFLGDYSLSAPWSENGVKGAKKFLDRVMKLPNYITDEKVENEEITREMNVMIKKVTEDYLDMKFNTAIAAMMSYVNVIYKAEKVNVEYILPLIKLLYPVAPHVAEELNLQLNNKTEVFNLVWPKYDESKMKQTTVELAVLINSAVRFKINVDTTLSENEIEEIVKNDDRLKDYLTEGKEIRKVIVVKGRMVNLVIK